MVTPRERMMRTLRREGPDRVPDLEFGAWEQTIARWHDEGLPKEYNGVWDVMPKYFGTEDWDSFGIHCDCGLLPGFKHEIVEERGDHIIKRDGDGALVEMIRPELGASIPRYIRHAVETREDWERLKRERLDPDSPGRVPEDLGEVRRKAALSDRPVTVGAGSLYGFIRNWMGFENLSYAVHDDPEWVEEMMEHMAELAMANLRKLAAAGIKADICSWWEDMCYNTGPLLSPDHFRRWMVPRYRRVTDFLRDEMGCEFNMLDCDGHIHHLAGPWMEAGINVTFPLEVAANSDGYRLRREHPEILIRGHYDKRAIIEGRDAIDREFERIGPLFGQGGFIPHVDHLVSPDTSLENYVYYREQKMRFIGKA
ncbi:MAG: uroporphyrinogen decarboxylase family protein [Oscillospiraceae bacterium]|nr:uroporphyrinogen decarboxylase family protein [Oscillospiraceae bacterium]